MIMPQVGFTDMSDEDQSAAFEICREAYSKYFFMSLLTFLFFDWAGSLL